MQPGLDHGLLCALLPVLDCSPVEERAFPGHLYLSENIRDKV